jgi:hypothetical protein
MLTWEADVERVVAQSPSYLELGSTPKRGLYPALVHYYTLVRRRRLRFEPEP